MVFAPYLRGFAPWQSRIGLNMVRAMQTGLHPYKMDKATAMTDAQETTHFGERIVAMDAKQGMVNAVFHGVADRYDLMNDLMSAGVHRIWKDGLVNELAPPKSGSRPYRVLDMAGGTGDIAERIINASVGYAEVVVSDINSDMLRVGADRAKGWRYPVQASFVEANAEELPFADNSFDAYTIAFGIRNVPRIQKALDEAHRVLKRGGRILVLEFSQVDVPGFDAVYSAFSDRVIPPMGKLVTGDAQPYQYLVESIRKFPPPPAFSAMLSQAGFKRVKHTPYSGNIATLFSGWKI
jgi:demethylmenaquinone methyltransferase/2-methoxy-6-polyprenyl-1,4-benzoquinol methylase